MTLDEAVKMFENNAEYERIRGNFEACFDFRQLAKWLKDYMRLREIVKEPDSESEGHDDNNKA